MIDRRKLTFGVGKHDLTGFICSRCRQGLLTPVNGLDHFHPPYSANWMKDGGTYEDVQLSLCATLQCSAPHCGAQAIIRCEGGVEPDYSQGHDGPLEEYFFIRAFSPSPHLIKIPAGVPKAVVEELKKSFDVFWSNKTLAANSIRNCIEAMLSHFGVPDEVDGKWVSLGNRIRTYAEIDTEHSEFFSVLRPIINSGSHGEELETGVILDIYEALEIFLETVFSDRTTRFKELTENLKSRGSNNL